MSRGVCKLEFGAPVLEAVRDAIRDFCFDAYGVHVWWPRPYKRAVFEGERAEEARDVIKACGEEALKGLRAAIAGPSVGEA